VMRSLVMRLPLVVATVGYVVLGGHPFVGGVAVLLTLLPSLVARAPRGVDAVFASFAAVGGATFAALVPATEDLLGAAAPRRLYDAVALAGVLAVGARVPFKRPIGGYELTLGIAMLGVMGLGDARPLTAFVPLTIGFVAAAMGGLTAADPRRALSLPASRQRVAIIAATFIALAVTAVLGRALPVANAYVMTWFEGSEDRRAGFGDTIALGGLREILDDDSVALRVFGEHVDHLRGAVYTRYGAGRWYGRLGARGARTDVSRRAVTTFVEHVDADDEHWFVPLDAEVVDVPGGIVTVDELGVIAPPEGVSADRIGIAATAPRVLLPPDEDDLALPDALRPELRRVLRAWTSSSSPSLDSIRAKLATFTYALQIPEHDPDKDPVLAFLEDHQTGHCEYFASAMALLARASGVPARVVGGYLVVERNALGGHWVVRQRNAHAWVEAYVDGAWRTFDPTPASGLRRHMPEESVGFDAFVGLVAVYVNRFGRFVYANVAWFAPTLVLLAILFLFRRELRAWFVRSEGPTEVAVTLSYATTDEAYAAFEARLGARGFRREEAETLERFAARLAEDPALVGDAELVLRYAVVRYAGRADAALSADLTAP
jgi:hypothetical protein